MFKKGDVIDGKYLVEGICSIGGGMGGLLFVVPFGARTSSQPLVLKYCKITDPDLTKRFAREVRLGREFASDPRFVEIVDDNVNHDPPYFVMRHYPDGDLSTLAPIPCTSDAELDVVERLLYSMADCVAEIHRKKKRHRDIKPQNFLRNGSIILISDLGLSNDLESTTIFTRTTEVAGTPSYMPPEFREPGGFRDADASSDIFMLGKTFYYLLTGLDPAYIKEGVIPNALQHVIKRACEVDKRNRFQSIPELKQGLRLAFDVLLKRGGGPAKTRQQIAEIIGQLERDNTFIPESIDGFVNQLESLDESDQIQISMVIDPRLFEILAGHFPDSIIRRLLEIYASMVEKGSYPWSFAETIACNLSHIFWSNSVNDQNKAIALRLSIYSAHQENRFAAMDTCFEMIYSISENSLVTAVEPVLREFSDTFVKRAALSSCKSDSVRKIIESLSR